MLVIFVPEGIIALVSMLDRFKIARIDFEAIGGGDLTNISSLNTFPILLPAPSLNLHSMIYQT